MDPYEWLIVKIDSLKMAMILNVTVEIEKTKLDK